MTFAKNKFLCIFLLTSAIASVSSLAYPIYVKIENPRSHSLYIASDSEKTRIEIAPGSFREFKVAGLSDWRVLYSSGIYGMAQWSLNKDLNYFIEKSCRTCMGDNWAKKTVKYCTLRLDEFDSAIAGSSYTLTVTEIRDLDIAYGTDQCKLSENEKALKVVAASSSCLLVAPDVLSKTMCLFAGLQLGNK